jgi:hypothetical protein
VLGACSSSELHSDEFCPTYARVECAAVKDACGVRDEQSCAALREAYCQTEVRRLLVGAKGFNPRGAQVCINKMEAAYAKTFIPVVEWREVKEACQHTYFGHRGAGESCRIDRECSGVYVCREGACGHPVLTGRGPDACEVSTGKPCPTGQLCITTSSQYVCRPPANAGEPCRSDGECRDNLCLQGKCAMRLAIGASCAMDRECQSPSRFCDPGSGLCATGFAVTPASDFCQTYLRHLTDGGPAPDARVRADAGDAPAADAPADVATPVEAPADAPDGDDATGG